MNIFVLLFSRAHTTVLPGKGLVQQEEHHSRVDDFQKESRVNEQVLYLQRSMYLRGICHNIERLASQGVTSSAHCDRSETTATQVHRGVSRSDVEWSRVEEGIEREARSWGKVRSATSTESGPYRVLRDTEWYPLTWCRANHKSEGMRRRSEILFRLSCWIW